MRKIVSDCPEGLLKSLPVAGKRVAHLRKLYGWTQKDLATVAKVSLHYVRASEQGRMVEVWVLWRLSDALRVRYFVLWVGGGRWDRIVAVREKEVGWDAVNEKPRTKQAGAGVELWDEGG